jgi:hypothetical protein
MRICNHKIVLLVLSLVFVLAACGSRDGGAATAVPQATATLEPTPTPQPTATPKPTATPVPTTDDPDESLDPDILSLAENLARFKSYRFNIDITIRGTTPAGVDTTASMQATIVNVADPPGASLAITATGVEQFETINSLAITQKGGTSYMSLPGLGCITSPAEGSVMESLGANFLDTSQFDTALEQAELVGEENINGIRVLHYKVDSSLIDDNDQFDEVTGDLYIAQDGGYLVRMILDGKGDIDFLSGSNNTYDAMHVEYNLTDTNQTFEITLPADCQKSGTSGSEYPVPDDAYDLASIPGFTSYKSEMALADIVDFYEEILPAEGWVKSNGDSFELEDTAVLVYTRAEGKLSITIGAEDSDTQFVLMSSE